MPNETMTPASHTFSLPGEAVFPESVGIDPATGEAYVGSLADGALYRLAPSGDVTTWSPAGRDGRSSVAGVKIDFDGRLWAAGGYQGTLYVYDLNSRRLLGRMDVAGRPSCVNDIAFGSCGEAYVTDSLLPVLFRVARDRVALEPWIDLAEQGVPWPPELNFNGIVVTPDGEHLVACQTNLGRFWRVELATGAVTETALESGLLEHCDGMALSGSTLYVAVNARDRIAAMQLAADGSWARIETMVRSEAFAFPTAVAVRDDRLLVVNGQLDKMGGEPALPFTVVAIAAPASLTRPQRRESAISDGLPASDRA